MAARTTQSWTSVPHFFMTREAHANGLLEVHKHMAAGIADIARHQNDSDRFAGRSGGHVLAKHPRMNASWAEEYSLQR